MLPTSETAVIGAAGKKLINIPAAQQPEKFRILIDIKHPAQLNLFKGLAAALQQKNWEITLCYLNRGRLARIVEKELQGYEQIPVGSSKGTRWSILWHGNIRRTFQFLKLLRKKQYNICVAASSIPLALACRLSGVPIIQFYDDPERKTVNRLNSILSTRLFFPPIVPDSRKIAHFNCLKEWSYLSPARFKPDLRVVNQYRLEPHQYIFIREVSNKSFNYFGQADGMILAFAGAIRPEIPVLLSLEDKSLADQYPAHWTLLEEPVSDIHSLIYYAKAVLSSGDSMAREGAMLGVPSFYCGIREMKANRLLMQEGILEHHLGESSLDPLNALLDKPFDLGRQHSFRNKLKNSWVDMIDFMMSSIDRYKLTFKTKKHTI